VRRFVLWMALALGLTLGTVFAQQETPPPPPVPVQPGDQTKPRIRQPMTEEQREQRLDAQWSKLPVETKAHLMRLHRALVEMPPDERKFIHDRIERFLNMSPAERERLRQNRLKWDQMSPEERQKAREVFRKRRQEIEEKWNREHPGGESSTNAPSPSTAPSFAPQPNAGTP